MYCTFKTLWDFGPWSSRFCLSLAGRAGKDSWEVSEAIQSTAVLYKTNFLGLVGIISWRVHHSLSLQNWQAKKFVSFGPQECQH